MSYGSDILVAGFAPDPNVRSTLLARADDAISGWSNRSKAAPYSMTSSARAILGQLTCY